MFFWWKNKKVASKTYKLTLNIIDINNKLYEDSYYFETNHEMSNAYVAIRFAIDNVTRHNSPFIEYEILNANNINGIDGYRYIKISKDEIKDIELWVSEI